MDEYVSKQVAIKAFENNAHLEWGYLRVAMPLLKTLETIPAADVAPVVHGYWIRHDDADIVEGYYVPEYECSGCKGWVKDDTDFCPNCGIKMDGGKDNG